MLQSCFWFSIQESFYLIDKQFSTLPQKPPKMDFFPTVSQFTLLLSINIVPFCERLIFGDLYIIVLSILGM